MLAAVGWTALALGAGAAAYLLPHLAKQVQIRALRERCRRAGTLVLTYDDGPGAALTPRLLDLLGRFDAPATFLLLGSRAAARPDLVDAILAAGHEIGCHGQWHRHPWRTTPWRAVDDIRAGYATLAPWLTPDALYRPPNGKLTLPTAWYLWRRRAPLAWWTIDSGDVHDPLSLPGGALAALQRDGGGVVLLHDFDRALADAPARAEFVLRTSESLLEYARATGLAVRSLGQVL